MAVNDMIVRILGDSRSVERAFARSSNAATQFNRNVETTGRKLDSNAKKFSGFAKGAAAGFGGAVAFNAAVNGIRSVALAAAESQQVLGQTRVALESTGKSWEQYGQTIQDTVKAQSRLGFDDEALLRTFSQFQRTTGDVSEALRLNNLAMDVARARFIDLESAAGLVTKAAIGNAGALRRLGIDAKVGSSGIELLTLLTEKYGGSAEAAAEDSSTSFARTQVAVENLQESIGTLLLPALEKLAEHTETAAQFAQNLSDALNKIGSVKIPKIEIPFDITIGGTTVGDAAGGLLSKLKFTPLNPLFGLTIANAIADQFRDQARAAEAGLADRFAADINVLTFNAMTKAAGGATRTPPAFGQKGFKPLTENTLGDEVAAAFEAQLDALSLQFDKAAADKGIQNDLAVLAEMRRVIQARIATQGRTTDLMRLLFVNDQQRQAVIAGDAAAAASARAKTAAILAKDAADRVARAREEAEIARRTREALRAQVQARQFRALGLASSGEEIVPGIKNLQTRISGALRRINSGQLDVSSKLVQRLKLARKSIREDGKNLTDDTRRVINDLINTVTQGQNKLDKATQGPLTETTSLRANKLLAGMIGLTPEVERELRARLSSFNSAGLAVAGTSRPTGGFRGGEPVTVHTTVNLDGKVVATNTTSHQQKTRKRNPVQKRGSRRGGV